MIFHPEEYESAKKYWKGRNFPAIRVDQLKVIQEKGKDLMKFHRRHPFIHNAISLFVFAIIFGADWWILMRSGSLIHNNVLSGILIGILHSYVMYSLVIFTIHEGRAHKLIVADRGRLSHFFAIMANNAGRIALAESDYYARHHLKHHAYFTTPKDEEFLNFIYPKRLLKSFIPYASIFNFNDFKAHTGFKYTASRMLSIALFLLYHAAYVLAMRRHLSWDTIVIAFVIISPNLSFWLDRLRQYTEHNLMPLDVVNGIRDLGLGFWGMLIGGGPWGQPCHWSHHLAPWIPWYNQIRLHNYIKKILTQEQKKVFFIKPIIGFPKKLMELIKMTGRCAI